MVNFRAACQEAGGAGSSSQTAFLWFRVARFDPNRRVTGADKRYGLLQLKIQP
jgi:hypothetical protein